MTGLYLLLSLFPICIYSDKYRETLAHSFIHQYIPPRIIYAYTANISDHESQLAAELVTVEVVKIALLVSNSLSRL